MPQKTNLNVSPYFDDFNSDKNFYKVLFKPGYPVQARELTSLQSIFQHQLESFGSNIFKEGSMVVPGAITYDPNYYSVKINPDHLGLDVTLYIKELVGKTLKGRNSGITAIVKNYSIPPSDGVEDIVLYVKYLASGENLNLQDSQFLDGEVLITLDNIVYGNTTINSDDTVATVSELNATATGSAVGITKGVYFIRGSFVDVNSSIIVLDPFSNTTSYRVGLNIFEEIVTSNEDSSLYDNAKGFSNYAAPGADRFKITTVLAKKSLSDFDDKNFIELLRVEDGIIKKLQDKSTYSIIKDYLAQRTYDESGDYSLQNFNVDILNSLNDGISNEGIYFQNQKTSQGNTPSDELLCVKISPGKAYVRGFDINFPSTTILDVEKPRDINTVNSALIPFQMGNLLKVNNVSGTPFIGISTSGSIINLYNRRRANTGTPDTSGSGSLIGQARLYSFNVADASYVNASSLWDLYLFDVQTYTSITTNVALNATNCPSGSFIRGLSSNASGYIVSDASSTTILLTQTSGTFVVGEQLLINESSNISCSIVSVTVYSTNDIKSVYQDSTSVSSYLNSDFSADAILYKSVPINFSLTDRITINNAGIVTCPGKNFLSIKPDSIIRYQKSSQTLETFNRVSSVSTDGSTMTLASVTNIPGVCDGTLPSSTETTTFSLGTPLISGLTDSKLYVPINKKDVSDVNLSNSNLIISKQIGNLSTNSSGTLTVNVTNTGISSAFFETFESSRYSVFYSNGSVEDLTEDQVLISGNGTQLTVSGLTPSSSNVVLNATLIKDSVTSKTKYYSRSEKIVIDKTSSGVSTSISGLTTSFYYGLRVEDPEISLNLPDVSEVIAVYESLSTNQPDLDKLEFYSGLNLNTSSVLGEKIIGQTSGAVAQLVTKSSPTIVEFVYLNSKKFELNEIVSFEESKIIAPIQNIVKGNYLDITNRYSLDKNQKEQYYDYSKIVRKQDSYKPSRKLLVIFNCYKVPSNDNGDVFTVNSYTKDRFTKDIPLLKNGLRASDTLDFRPRVSPFTSNNTSPFSYSAKIFERTINYVVSPRESSIIKYSHYLPRIDRLFLDKEGKFRLVKGVSAELPKEPVNIEEAMSIATISLPAYLYDPKDTTVTLYDNKRYTMRDIGKLENRINTLEITTSLSLLELDTKTLQIQDSDGLSRFKTGFFVDDFKNNSLIEKNNSDVKCDVDTTRKKLIPAVDFWSLKYELALDPSINPNTADFSSDLPLLDPNVKKTGDLITLNYIEKGWIEQPLASNVENVNPFNIVDYSGGIILSPSSDNWVRNVYIENTRVETATTTTTTSSVSTSVRVRSSGWPIWKINPTIISSTTATENVGSKQVGEFDYVESIQTSKGDDPYIRSRNIEFRSGGLKPFTQHYAFFDDSSSIDIIPKLLEVQMQSGTFEVGENVIGYFGEESVISFRLCKPNHKSGTYNNPTITYGTNPYDRNSTLSESYSASSTILNVDTFSLSEESLTRYGGYVQQNVQLIGQTSKAIANITNVRLVTDNYGDVIGCFYIREPNVIPPPLLRFKTGQKTFKLNAYSDNTVPLSGLPQSSAETNYVTSGIVQTQITNNVQVRNPPPPPPPPPPARRTGGKDPLAQTFTVDESGAFLTSVDLYFATKDPNEKLYVELRTVELGTPTNQLVQDYSRVVLEPSQILTSNDSSVPTNIKFSSPIYLEPRTEYALVLLSPTSDLYNVWVGTMGQKTVNTQNLPNSENVVVTKQYVGGSLFKSQNGTIWTPNQYQDLKFKLYKANFTSSTGDVVFYNPPLRVNEDNIPTLKDNPIKVLPRKLKVKIKNTNSFNSTLVTGTKVSTGTVGGSGPIGYIQRVGGASTALTISNVGTGYSNGTFSNVPLYSITGNGNGATADLTFSGGSLSSVSIASSGTGYSVGDLLGVTTASVVKGSNSKISVSSIYGIDTLYLNNVRGETFTQNSNLIYYNGNTRVSAGVSVLENSSLIDNLYQGNIFEVTQFNHGMHGTNNFVTLSNVEPDTVSVKLLNTLNITDNTISVASTDSFNTFEGITTTRGYLKVNNEIIFYNSIGTNTLGIGSRGIDGTSIQIHPSNSVVKKYELNGVSLTRINTTHDMTTANNAALNVYKDLDKYYLAFEGNGSGINQISFNDEKVLGGNNVSASQNYQYNSIVPQFNIITPGQNTSISAELRSTSGTSSGGSEISFLDQGYSQLQLNKVNFLSTPRLVASEVNENNRLSFLPRKKSLTTKITLSSTDPNLSPVIDTQTAFMVLGRNRVNYPIKDYAVDGRVNVNNGDPHSSVYISQKVDLKQPATSLKVYISAYRPAEADFRVLYKLYKSDSTEIEQSFNLFPGYENLRDKGTYLEVIDPSRNNGKSDIYVRPSKLDEYLEYEFTADNLEQFTGYAIKIVFSSTNESQIPLINDIRTIALA